MAQLRLTSVVQGTLGNQISIAKSTGILLAPEHFSGGVNDAPTNTATNLSDFLNSLHPDFESVRDEVTITFRAKEAGFLSMPAYLSANTDRIWTSNYEFPRGENASEFMHLFQFPESVYGSFAVKNNGTEVFSVDADGIPSVNSHPGVSGEIYIYRSVWSGGGYSWAPAKITVTNGIVTNVETLGGGSP
jgi:hypothetical protein